MKRILHRLRREKAGGGPLRAAAGPEDGTVYDFTVYPEGFVRETTA